MLRVRNADAFDWDQNTSGAKQTIELLLGYTRNIRTSVVSGRGDPG
jgi:hypothetical protein